MSYVNVYRMWFTNDKGQDTIIHISDTLSGTGTTTFHGMQDGDGNELIQSAKLSTANDAEDKLSIIRSLRFSCVFLSTDTYNVDFFVEGEDNRWLVEVFIGLTTNPAIFTGYLVPDGAKDTFLDYGLFGVELTASDLLQSISETALRKPDGTVPKGKFTLIEYVSWCLQKTFLQLPINVVYNLHEEHQTAAGDNFFRRIYLEALSFETDINEREDCLTVLRKLLLGCFICQRNSEWWIVRVDEMDDDYQISNFSYTGTYIGTNSGNYLKNIGLGENINIINEDGQIFPEREIKYARQEFRFETWQEIICNINYTRGTLNGSITVPSGYQAFNPVDCWFNGKNPDGSAPTAPDVPGYMRKKVTNGYEEERLLVLPQSSFRPHYYETEGFLVNQLDKFKFSVDRKLTSDHTTSGWITETIFKIKLRGNDGSYWSLIGNAADGKVGSWKQGIGGFPSRHYETQYQPSQEDETQWMSFDIEADPCPVTGTVTIQLWQSNQYGSVNDTHFANLQLDYIPIIDGVYQKVTGQAHKVSNTSNRKANKDEQIYISDAPSPNWKGVLWRDLGSSTYERISRVYDYRHGTLAGYGLQRFGAYQDFALWNQYNRTIRKFQANLSGLETSTGEVPTMVNRFLFTDSSVATDNKVYQLLNFDMDLATCEWSGTFADAYDTTSPKEYTSTHEFNYLTK